MTQASRLPDRAQRAGTSDAQLLTDVVTRLRRALRTSIRTDYPWESLPMAQVELLMALADHAPAKIGTLASLQRLAPNTVSGLVQQLVEAGLASRETDKDDRRVARVTLTDAGRRQLAEWQDAHERRIGSALDRLDGRSTRSPPRATASRRSVARVIEHLRIPTEAGTFDALAAGPADGREVLLLHGFPEAASEWEYQLDALGSAQCRAVAPDQRGYSPDARPADAHDYRLDDLVADVIAMADALGWARLVLVGHDWGAAVAWGVASAHPDRLRTLTAVSIPHPIAFSRALRDDEDQRQRSHYFQVFAQVGNAEKSLLANDCDHLRRIYDRKVPAGRIDDYIARFREPGALTAALNWYRAMRMTTLRIDKITVPTLYVWSTEDVAVGSTAALACGEQVSGPYTFEMLEDVSHWIPEQAAGTFTAMLMRHLLAFAD
jgi:pimeloyl-ACP methyl ester carboxylesterase/DNA-binding MarR family transcriptional regulator